MMLNEKHESYNNNNYDNINRFMNESQGHLLYENSKKRSKCTQYNIQKYKGINTTVKVHETSSP